MLQHHVDMHIVTYDNMVKIVQHRASEYVKLPQQSLLCTTVDIDMADIDKRNVCKS